VNAPVRARPEGVRSRARRLLVHAAVGEERAIPTAESRARADLGLKQPLVAPDRLPIEATSLERYLAAVPLGSVAGSCALVDPLRNAVDPNESSIFRQLAAPVDKSPTTAISPASLRASNGPPESPVQPPLAPKPAVVNRSGVTSTTSVVA
jgi:hypothetical protein